MLIGELQKNAQEKIRVEHREYKGREFVDMRVYFEGNDGQWLPTKKGLAISPAILPALIDLLKAACGG